MDFYNDEFSCNTTNTSIKYDYTLNIGHSSSRNVKRGQSCFDGPDVEPVIAVARDERLQYVVH
jgi:hypothetical protein